MKSKKQVLSNSIVKEYVEENFGPNGLKIINAIPIKKTRSEYKIADNAKININNLRSVLYKFYSEKMVYYNRNRDPVKGWFIYNWMFHLNRLLEVILREKKAILKTFEDRQVDLNADGSQLYYCVGCKSKSDFENAFNKGFICSKCNSNFEPFEIKKDLNKLKREIKMIDNQIKELEALMK